MAFKKFTIDDYKNNINLLINHYLIFSYLYYEKGFSFVSNDLYDEMCKLLLKNIKKVKGHIRENLIDPEALKAGTGFHLKNKYPTIVISCANMILKKNKNSTIDE